MWRREQMATKNGMENQRWSVVMDRAAPTSGLGPLPATWQLLWSPASASFHWSHWKSQEAELFEERWIYAVYICFSENNDLVHSFWALSANEVRNENENNPQFRREQRNGSGGTGSWTETGTRTACLFVGGGATVKNEIGTTCAKPTGPRSRTGMETWTGIQYRILMLYRDTLTSYWICI